LKPVGSAEVSLTDRIVTHPSALMSRLAQNGGAEVFKAIHTPNQYKEEASSPLCSITRNPSPLWNSLI
jgi:hypothetical protein